MYLSDTWCLMLYFRSPEVIPGIMNLFNWDWRVMNVDVVIHYKFLFYIFYLKGIFRFWINFKLLIHLILEGVLERVVNKTEPEKLAGNVLISVNFNPSLIQLELWYFFLKGDFALLAVWGVDDVQLRRFFRESSASAV